MSPLSEVLAILPGYPLLVCRTCERCLLTSSIEQHLKHDKSHRGHYLPEEIRSIRDAAERMPGFSELMANQTQLRCYTLPSGPIPVVKELSGPKTGGIACKYCPQVIGRHRDPEEQMRRHLIKYHKDETLPGRSDHHASEAFREGPLDLHCRLGVLYQQFFSSGLSSQLIEVSVEERPCNTSAAPSDIPDNDQMVTQWQLAIEARHHATAAVSSRTVNIVELDVTNANPWLNRTGFPDHVHGLSVNFITKLRSHAKVNEPELKFLSTFIQEFVPWLLTAADTISRRDNNSGGIVQSSVDGSSQKPFKAPQQRESHVSYGRTLSTIVLYLVRTANLEYETGRRWSPTDLQLTTLTAAMSTVQSFILHDRPVPRPDRHDHFSRQMLQFLLSLWDHILSESHHESVLYSALAAMALDRSGSWKPVQLFTPKLAALKCISKALVLVQAHVEYHDALVQTQGVSSGLGARSSVAGVAARVAEMTARFLAPAWDAGNNSTPAMWIHHTLTYGRAVSSNEPLSHAHEVEWADHFQTLRMHECTIRIHELRDFAAKLIFDLKEQLSDLLLLDGVSSLEASPSGNELPVIPWCELSDSVRDRSPFGSFLTCNPALDRSQAATWIFRRIIHNDSLRGAWLTSDPPAPGSAFNLSKDTALHYRKKMREFVRTLALCFLFLCGQPPRCPEITTMRWCNAANGAPRNIFVQGVRVLAITRYHKKQHQHERSNPVYRMLPSDAATSLIYYLWLVLPFYHQIHAETIDPNVEANPYLFTDNFCLPSNHPGLSGVNGPGLDPAFCAPLAHVKPTTTSSPFSTLGDEATPVQRSPSSSTKYEIAPPRSISPLNLLQPTPQSSVVPFPVLDAGPIVDPRGSRVIDDNDGYTTDEAITDADSEADHSGDEIPRLIGGSDGTDNVPARWSRRVLPTHVARYASEFLAEHVNVQRWRHFAIAIARKHCSGQSTIGSEMAKSSLLDHLLERQPGHTSQTGRQHYGRLENNISLGPDEEREGYCSVSVAWQTFLGIPSPALDLSATRGLDSLRDARREAEEALQRRRLNKLRASDLEACLQIHIGQGKTDSLEKFTFRPGQRETLQAVVEGHPFVLQIAGTGVGKSLTFELIARAQPDGTTIVIVPLLSLQADLARRCEAALIDVHVFRPGQPGRAASIVLVTPEVFLSRAFSRFTHRLLNQVRLDRIVCDEAHLILDAHDGFRPSLLEVPDVICQLGVQTVLLTATLPPLEQPHFLQRFKIDSPAQVTVIRSSTRRPNIRYSVRSVKSRAHERYAAVDAAQQLRLRYNRCGGKIVVFACSRDTTEAIAADLDCPFFHAQSGTEEERDAVVRTFAQCKESNLLVATSAFGMGIDVKGIRGVIHCGAYPSLRDLIQASGRGGRDGQVAESILVLAERPAGQATRVTQVQRFSVAETCRRLVIDGVMDGVDEAAGVVCSPGEAPCDVCQPTWDGKVLATTPILTSNPSVLPIPVASPAGPRTTTLQNDPNLSTKNASTRSLHTPKNRSRHETSSEPRAEDPIANQLECRRSGDASSSLGLTQKYPAYVNKRPISPPVTPIRPGLIPPNKHAKSRFQANGTLPVVIDLSSPSETSMSAAFSALSRQSSSYETIDSPQPTTPGAKRRRSSSFDEEERYPTTSRARHENATQPGPVSSGTSLSSRNIQRSPPLPSIARPSLSHHPVSHHLRDTCPQQASNAAVVRQRLVNKEHEDFSRLVGKSRGACFVCLAGPGLFNYHTPDECGYSSPLGTEVAGIHTHEGIDALAQRLRRRIRTALPPRPYVGCLTCLQPHPDCPRWEPKSDGRAASWQQVRPEVPCRDEDILLFQLYIALYALNGDRAERLVRKYVASTGSLSRLAQSAAATLHDEPMFLQWAVVKQRWFREETMRFNSLLVHLFRESGV